GARYIGDKGSDLTGRLRTVIAERAERMRLRRKDGVRPGEPMGEAPAGRAGEAFSSALDAVRGVAGKAKSGAVAAYQRARSTLQFDDATGESDDIYRDVINQLSHTFESGIDPETGALSQARLSEPRIRPDSRAI